MPTPPELEYKYAWGNNPKRAELKNKPCRLMASGKMGSVLVQFRDGVKIITSRRALRKSDNPPSKGAL